MDTTILERQLDYHFQDPGLLARALTHSTYAYETPGEMPDNERLEFLGDAVLQLVISQALFFQPDHLPEGDMTKKRALVVCEQTLSQVARKLDVGRHLKLGRGEETTGGRDKTSNVANAMEAIFGAVFLDGGFEEARRVILAQLTSYLDLALAGILVYDFKSRLLEQVQSTRGTSEMRFEIVDEEGPVHDRVFTARVVVDEQEISRGKGSSKKEAEQQAAKSALHILICDRDGCKLRDLI